MELSQRPATASGGAVVRPLDVQRLKQGIKKEKEVAVVWPPPRASAVMEEKKRRLSPHRVSSKLRRAVYGQSLDRVLAQREESDNSRGHHSGQQHDTATTVEISGEEQFSPSATKRNKNNNIFLVAAQEATAGDEQGVLQMEVDADNPQQQSSAQWAKELTRMSDAHYRRGIHSIGHREYTIIRKLFQEIDDKHAGYVELSQVLAFHHRFPLKVEREILDNLKVELDGRVYLDEMIRVHFPSLSQQNIEQLLELYEPKVQSMDSLKPLTVRHMAELYQSIMEKYSHATFGWWLASVNTSRNACELTDLGVTATSRGSQASQHHKTGSEPRSVPSGSEHDSSAHPDEDQVSARSGRSAESTGTRPQSARHENNIAHVQQQQIHLNAMQLFLFLQQSAQYTMKEFLGLFRLKHLSLKPVYPVVLSRAIRRGNTRSGARGANVVPPAGFVIDPTTGLSLPLQQLLSASVGGEPSFPFLTSCTIRFKDFAVLLMDYFAMKQSDAYVEPYDPKLRALLDTKTWEKMFPFTGSVKDYFIKKQE